MYPTEIGVETTEREVVNRVTHPIAERFEPGASTQRQIGIFDVERGGWYYMKSWC
jgi:hypothetical protein